MLESPFWYDSATGLSSKIRKSRQIVFEGKTRVGNLTTKQWLEPFGAIITDKRITKQDLWIKIRVGDYEAEGDSLQVLE
jgi:hypothetical protein